MNHIGVLKALLEASLLPRIISGASAGSIVAAVLCTRTDDEIPNILDEFPYGNLDVFEDGKNPESVLHRVGRFLKIGAWIDIKHLTGVMRELLGDITFQEAYNRTRRILSICVSSASVYELPRLLNYISAPNVLIWSAVAASCSVPFLFSATALLAKDPKTGLPVPWNPTPQRWIDGSVENDLPMTRLAEMFNVNHFIVSQVNPHVVPFLSKEDLPLPETPSNVLSWGETAVKLAMGETLHRMNVLAELGIFRTSLTKARCVLSQKYSGDITIFPEIALADLPKILKNPTPEFMFAATLRGERATWPKLSRIRNHCAIELALDMAIHQLRTRVVFEGGLWRTSCSNRGYGAGAITAGVVPTVEVGRGGRAGVRRRMRSHDPSRGRGTGAASPVLVRSGSRGAVRAKLEREDADVGSYFPKGASLELPGGEAVGLEIEVKGGSVEDNGYGWCLMGDESDGDGGDDDETAVVANMGRRRMPGMTARGRTMKKWEKGVGRMTGRGEEECCVTIGIGRAKSAEELRGLT